MIGPIRRGVDRNHAGRCSVLPVKKQQLHAEAPRENTLKLTPPEPLWRQPESFVRCSHHPLLQRTSPFRKLCSGITSSTTYPRHSSCMVLMVYSSLPYDFPVVTVLLKHRGRRSASGAALGAIHVSRHSCMSIYSGARLLCGALRRPSYRRFERRHFAQTTQVARSLAELSPKESLDEVPGHEGPNGSRAHTNDVHVVVLDPLGGLRSGRAPAQRGLPVSCLHRPTHRRHCRTLPPRAQLPLPPQPWRGGRRSRDNRRSDSRRAPRSRLPHAPHRGDEMPILPLYQTHHDP